MANLSGFPSFELEFTKEGKIFDPAAVDVLMDGLNDQVTDLFIISHGWNNDMKEARNLYAKLVAIIAKQNETRNSDRKFAIAGVLWPSKKFADKDLIPSGGAASLGTDPSQELLLSELDELKDFFDTPQANAVLEKAKDAAKNMDGSTAEQDEFVKQMNELLTAGIQDRAHEPDEQKIESFKEVSAQTLLAEMERDEDDEVQTDGGGAADFGGIGGVSGSDSGTAAGFSFGGVFAGARNLLNFVTYYQMKERAGKIGSLGLHPLLVKIRNSFPNIKLHLIGHSFGGRLVTAAIAGTEQPSNLKVHSLALLQAAFSHYGFAENYDNNKTDGAFRRVVKEGRVTGPIIISHTHNDKAVGIAYALASRIARQIGANFVGGKNDKFGGMGGNGAQITPEANNDFSLKSGTVYSFKKGGLYNLNGDSCITGHSDICKEEVGRAIIEAVYTS